MSYLLRWVLLVLLRWWCAVSGLTVAVTAQSVIASQTRCGQMLQRTLAEGIGARRIVPEVGHIAPGVRRRHSNLVLTL